MKTMKTMKNETTIHNTKNQKITIKNVKLRNDMYGYSLDLTYLIDGEHEVSELHLPRVMLPLSNSLIRISRDDNYYGDSLYTCNVGLGNCRLLESDGVAYTLKTIETKTKEMTLDEIEKKLGHKVKIVNK